jgi:hypothetical protein
VLALAALIAVMVAGDVETLTSTTFTERYDSGALTGLELGVAWTALGLALYRLARRQPRP